MGGPGSGRKRRDECDAGHDLTDPGNVQVINRGDGKVERLCVICQRKRAREWWRKNRATTKKWRGEYGQRSTGV
jgi:hypothetical protein